MNFGGSIVYKIQEPAFQALIKMVNPRREQAKLYDGLDDTFTQIRLIRLRSKLDKSGFIRCDLRTFDLPEAPAYEALSYEWGDAESPQRVYVNGTELFVRRNLWKFLDVYRTISRSDVYLWIDQISINQADLHERSHQVQMMSHIFKRATQVIVWLGFHDHPRLVDVGRGIKTSLQQHWTTPCFCRKRHCLICPRPNRTFHEGIEEAIDALISLTYWRRLWIIQELALARQITFFLNEEQISKLDLYRFFRLFFVDKYRSASHMESEIGRLQCSGNLRYVSTLLNWSKYHSRSIWSVIGAIYTEDTEVRCTDSHDLVYGLLGMMKSVPGLRVDYTLPTAELIGDLLDMLVLDTGTTLNWEKLHGPSGITGTLKPLTRLTAILGMPVRWRRALCINSTTGLEDAIRDQNMVSAAQATCSQGGKIPIHSFSNALSAFFDCLQELRRLGLARTGLDASSVLMIMAQVLRLLDMRVWHWPKSVDWWRYVRVDLEANRLFQLVRIANEAKQDCLEKGLSFTLPDLPLSAYDEPIDAQNRKWGLNR